ncbi:hypothetical protein HNY73_007988 [Argiope bruennichi]|uniref:Uncharacterized protein n=1 Tax=Argiope bruennichi TaxID=94029 RepID=A0A8T0F7N9_ARGBR|nr:hypothetical protein HNY73_007988 [Argiope bruennichi]
MLLLKILSALLLAVGCCLAATFPPPRHDLIPPPHQPIPHNTMHALYFDATRQAYVQHAFAVMKLEILTMPAVSGICLVLLVFLASCTAVELQQRHADAEAPRKLGLEEVVLFLIGLGVASALGLALMIGPMFAIFYSSIHGLPFERETWQHGYHDCWRLKNSGEADRRPQIIG